MKLNILILNYLLYTRWVNIKTEFKKFYRIKKGMGLSNMLKHLKMKFEGRPHSGIDDCHNTSRVIQRMITDDYNLNNALIQSC